MLFSREQWSESLVRVLKACTQDPRLRDRPRLPLWLGGRVSVGSPLGASCRAYHAVAG